MGKAVVMLAWPVPSKSMVMVALVTGLAISGCVLLFKTEMLVRQQRRRYEAHRWFRAYPFSSMVMKSWYPAYLRFSGVLILLWDLTLIYLFWFRKPVR